MNDNLKIGNLYMVKRALYSVCTERFELFDFSNFDIIDKYRLNRGEIVLLVEEYFVENPKFKHVGPPFAIQRFLCLDKTRIIVYGGSRNPHYNKELFDYLEPIKLTK